MEIHSFTYVRCLKDVDCADKSQFKSGAFDATEDIWVRLNVEIIFELAPWVFEKLNRWKQNPLHLAFENGNINKALQILDVIRQHDLSLYTSMMNQRDCNKRRAIDLLEYWQHSEIKAYKQICSSKSAEKNYKVKKNVSLLTFSLKSILGEIVQTFNLGTTKTQMKEVFQRELRLKRMPISKTSQYH